MAEAGNIIGKTLNHYHIESELGRGGMGTVYLAEDNRLNRKVALKVLPPEMAENSINLVRFKREVKTLASLNHPNIVTIYSVEEAEGLHFYTMELVDGKNLSQLIPGEGLPLDVFFTISVPLVDALRVAHERNITHRDLKPDNIIVCEDGRVKVLDFGLAKLMDVTIEEADTASHNKIDGLTRDGAVIGTLAYMSPEQAMGKTLDQRSDIFSLGIILYQMATGKHPFDGSTSLEIISAIMKDPPQSMTVYNNNLPASLWEITSKCLAKRPEQRYQSSSDVHQELNRLKMQYESGEDLVGTGEREKLSHLFSHVQSLTNGLKRPGFWLVSLSVLFLALVSFFFLSQKENIPVAISQTPNIAVLYFDDLTGSENWQWLSKGLPSMLITGLAQMPEISVVSSQRIYEVMNKHGQDARGSINKALLGTIGRQCNANYVIIGSILQTPTGVRIDVQIEDSVKGKLLDACSVVGSDIFALVDELVVKIGETFNVKPLQKRGITEITTASLDAFELYTKGQEANMGLRWYDAIDYFEKAIEIDPTFALAYFELSRLGSKINESEQVKVAREYREKVLANLDRLPERKQLLIRADYALDSDRGQFIWTKKRDVENGRQLLEKLIERYPDEEEAYIMLSTLYLDDLMDFDKAFRTMKKGVDTIPQSGTLLNQYGYYLQRIPRHDEALKVLETYARLNPDEPNPYDSLGEAKIKTGYPREAIDFYSKALSIDEKFISAYNGRGYASMMLGQYESAFKDFQRGIDMMKGIGLNKKSIPSFMSSQGPSIKAQIGEVTAAHELLAGNVKHYLQYGNEIDVAWCNLVRAKLFLEEKKYDKAHEIVDEVRTAIEDKISPAIISILPALTEFVDGVVYAHSGNIEKAKDAATRLKTLMIDSYSPERLRYHLLLGEIALAEKDYETAVSEFTRAEPVSDIIFMTQRSENIFDHWWPFRDGIARTWEARGNIDNAISEYTRLIGNGPEMTWISPLDPRFYIKLARLYEKKNEKELAANAYQEYLSICKNADADHPLVLEAKKYLQKLAFAPKEYVISETLYSSSSRARTRSMNWTIRS